MSLKFWALFLAVFLAKMMK